LAIEERVGREKAAYDEGNVWEESHKIQQRFHHVFESPNTQYGEQFFEAKLAEYCEGNTVLDYGCLDGDLAPKYRGLGARKIIGIDISEKGIEKATRRYGHIGEFHVCDAHDLSWLKSGEIDFIVGRAILHHLDFERAMREVMRVLRVGGAAMFVEPLYDNPAAKLFRAMTSEARTKDERPLSQAQIEWADTLFIQHEHRYCNLLTTPFAMLTSTLPLPADNALLKVADKVDRKLEQSSLRYWMRMSYLFWKK
jgi:ubiquinone/menaquinone biosynthesis C-methylase UbiE